MSEITWTVTEPNKGSTVVSNRAKLAHQQPFEINDKLAKNQIPFAKGWNEMRERLILLGEMEPE